MPTKSSQQWLKEHFNDPYVKKAQQLGYRSRAVFKLLEIQERDHLFKPGMVVIDLGSAPGGWSQAVKKLIGKNGQLFALDILPMEAIPGVHFIQGDFTQDQVFQGLINQISPAKADWVISDMAPNTSGNESIDIPRSMHLAELALDFALKTLNDKGGFLVKIFEGEGMEAFIAQLKINFKKIVIRKPKSSRGRSREIYLLARELRF